MLIDWTGDLRLILKPRNYFVFLSALYFISQGSILKAYGSFGDTQHRPQCSGDAGVRRCWCPKLPRWSSSQLTPMPVRCRMLTSPFAGYLYIINSQLQLASRIVQSQVAINSV